MITIQEYLRLLERNTEIIKMQTAGLSMEDMLLQPTDGGNCMLWVLGHLTDNLRGILRVVDEPSPALDLDLSPFLRGSPPVAGFDPSLPTPEQILGAYDSLHQLIVHRFQRLDEMYFAEELELFPGSIATRGWWAYFFSFHHSYHIGQLELLRNLAGHHEKLI